MFSCSHFSFFDKMFSLFSIFLGNKFWKVFTCLIKINRGLSGHRDRRIHCRHPKPSRTSNKKGHRFSVPRQISQPRSDARRVPNTTASWNISPMPPRILFGAISERYMGHTTQAAPSLKPKLEL